MHHTQSSFSRGQKMQSSFAVQRFHSFQLFGFDFLLDENGKVWLLEINGSPACAQCVPCFALHV